MAKADEVLASALSLPEETRAELALHILDSLPPSSAMTDDEWITEIERRARRVLNGESLGAPWSDVRSRIDNELKK